MPDGANAENTDTENADATDEQEPGSPAEQVDAEISREGVLSWWRSLFGGDQPYEAGGGGTGGQFMFASVEELDAVIAKWEDERDGILADRDMIADAFYMIHDPAGDMMSREQATASRDSLANMWQHSDAMLRYAENYIVKLRASRLQITTMEDGARTRMRSIQA